MHGERFDIEATKEDRLAGKSLSSLAFMYDPQWNEDVPLSIANLMNAFPFRTDSAMQPRTVKADILAGEYFAGFVVAQGDNFWVLLSEGMLTKSIEITRKIVAILAEDRRSIITSENQHKFSRLASYFVMELLVSHELYHISLGHVGHLGQTLGLGPSECDIPIKGIKTRSMELLADEAAITSTTLRTLSNNWYTIPPETPEHFSPIEMLNALSISVVGYVTCLSSHSPYGNDAYPSLHARLARIGDIYIHAMRSSRQTMGIDIINEQQIEEVFESFRDNFKIAKTYWRKLDPGGLLTIGKVLEGLYDPQKNGQAWDEVTEICGEIKQNMPLWQPYKCNILPWSSTV